MKKIFFLYLTLINIAWGYNYDDIVLKAQASIFPKIILLDKKIEDKLIDGEIVYTIIYNKLDYTTALSIEEFINKNFQGRLDKYNYTVNLVEFENFSENTKASAIYVLNLNEHTEKIANIVNKKGIISFSYDIDNLQKGLMFSLVIEKSTVLYLKKEILFTSKIEFVDALLQMVRFVEAEHIDYNNFHDQNKLESRTYYAKFFTSQQQ